MPDDKIKITKKELEDMYDIQEEQKQELPIEANAKVTFEEFSETQDQEAIKKFKTELDNA